jgi:hypothetical protein
LAEKSKVIQKKGIVGILLQKLQLSQQQYDGSTLYYVTRPKLGENQMTTAGSRTQSTLLRRVILFSVQNQ